MITKIHPEDYEVIANICDLRRFREYCTQEYLYLVNHYGDSEAEALTAVIVLATKLNAYNTNKGLANVHTT